MLLRSPDLCVRVCVCTCDVYVSLSTMQIILLASPPCQAYSIANTTSRDLPDLEEADKLVKAVDDIASALSACIVVLENPGTGKLVGRDVVAFLEHMVKIDYCCYGGVTGKETALWSSINLQQYGMQVSRCQRRSACKACVRAAPNRHAVDWELLSLDKRQSIPEQVSVQVAGAVIGFLQETWKPVRSTRSGRVPSGRRNA